MKHHCLRLLPAITALVASFAPTLHAQVPNLVSYQGRIAVGTVNFEGTGQFRFALVNADGTIVYWGNAADTAPANGVPDAAVSLPVNKGLYSVLLGDTSLTNMAAIPVGIWSYPDVRLRVWFNDGVNGNQLLTPDQRLAPTTAYLAGGSVGTSALADWSVTNPKLADGAVTAAKLGLSTGFNAANGYFAVASDGTTTAKSFESRWPGGTPYLDFSSTDTADYHARLLYTGTTDNALAFNLLNWGKYIFSNGSVGINTLTPSAILQLGNSSNVVPLQSSYFHVNGGSLSNNNFKTVASFGLEPAGGNQVTLAVRAYKHPVAAGWAGTMMGLTMDVDQTVGAGGTLYFYNGNVGINSGGSSTQMGLARLVVSGTSGGVDIGDYYRYDDDTNGFDSGVHGISIYATGPVAGSQFEAHSDARIKNIQGHSDGVADLGTLCGIEITNYLLKDVVAHGKRPQKKVIAQQVEKVFPQAVSKSVGVVPDIYQLAPTQDGWVSLATDLKVGERVKLIAAKEEDIHEVLEVRDGAFRTAYKPAAEKVFVFGREVNDFRRVDYEAIAMLNVSATQELAKQLADKDATIAALQKQLADNSARDEALEARLARIEAAAPAVPVKVVLNK